MCCRWAGMSARFYWEIDSRGLWSDLMVKDLPWTYIWNLSTPKMAATINLYVNVSAFGFSKGLAGKSHGFVILQECCSKAYL